MLPNETQPPHTLPISSQNMLVILVGMSAVTIALIQLLGPQSVWLLLLGGLILLLFAIRSLWSDASQLVALKTFLASADPRYGLLVVSGLIILTGLVGRFGPRDLGMVLIVIGVFLTGSALFMLIRLRFQSYQFSRVAVPAQIKPTSLHESASEEKSDVTIEDKPDEYAKLSQAFRGRIIEALFQNARNTSLMNAAVRLIFFLVGIGLFVLLAYGVYQMLMVQTRTGPDALSTYYLQELSYQLNGSTPPDELLARITPIVTLILRDIISFQLVPVIGLILLARIGSRLIENALRMSEQRVVRDALGELGPLQDILAGIPARKPYLQAVDQSFSHTRSAFLGRLRLSMALGVIGIGLLLISVARGVLMGDLEWITTVTIGASGLLAFLLSMVVVRQKEIGENLLQVTEEEKKVARHAQTSEIVDFYLAQMLRGATPQQLNGIREMLTWLQEDSKQVELPPKSPPSVIKP
jgi:hypothetical protein